MIDMGLAMAISENAYSVARDLVRQHGEAAPELAMDTAREFARRQNLPACSAWVRIYVAAVNVLCGFGNAVSRPGPTLH